MVKGCRYVVAIVSEMVVPGVMGRLTRWTRGGVTGLDRETGVQRQRQELSATGAFIPGARSRPKLCADAAANQTQIRSFADKWAGEEPRRRT